MKNSIQKRGYDAEHMVADYMRKDGYTILAQNYTTPRGEIDIIAQKDDAVVFTEVKMRSVSYFDISLVVTAKKQRKIIAAAQHYIVSNSIRDRVIRFDVALVESADCYTSLDIRYIADAFTCHESFI